MDRPVKCADGNIYEEAEIRRWLEVSKTSPMSGDTLIELHLTPARELHRRIQEWKKKGL